MKRAKAIDITVGDHFVYSSARLGDLTQPILVAIELFEHQNKRESAFLNQENTVNPDTKSSLRTNSWLQLVEKSILLSPRSRLIKVKVRYKRKVKSSSR